MKTRCVRMAAAALVACWPVVALAQTADEIVEKHVAASGGRAALGKLTSRIASGTISLTTPAGDIMGSIEVFNKAPNKSRTLINIDLSAFGAGKVVSDQRFDGVNGYVIDTFNGNREITGTELAVMRNASFPSPLLTYRESGTTIAMSGREMTAGKNAYVITLTPKTGPSSRAFIDPDTFLLLKTVMQVNVPQLGGDIEQVIEFSDYREVDGVKLPYVTKSSNVAQSVTATITSVKHNVAIDDASFVRPPGQ